MELSSSQILTTEADERVIKLPIEMQEHIIDCLDNFYEAGTIANCALVCRTWLPFSRYKLYSIGELCYHRQWTRFRDLILQSKSDSSITGYLGMMRELQVFPLDKEFFDEGRTRRRIGWMQGEERPWGHLVLDHCSLCLTGLMRIHMIEVDLRPSHDMTIHSGCFYRSLSTIELMSCTFTNIVQLQQFVTSFPALSDLNLSWLNLRSKTIPLHIPKRGHQLARLTLIGKHDVIGAVLQWLADIHLVWNLKYLYWWPANINKIEESWRTLIRVISGPSLQELRCYLPHSWQGKHFPCFQV